MGMAEGSLKGVILAIFRGSRLGRDSERHQLWRERRGNVGNHGDFRLRKNPPCFIRYPVWIGWIPERCGWTARKFALFRRMIGRSCGFHRWVLCFSKWICWRIWTCWTISCCFPAAQLLLLSTHLDPKKLLCRNSFFPQFWEGWYRYIRKLKIGFYMRRKQFCRHQKDIFRRGHTISLS